MIYPVDDRITRILDLKKHEKLAWETDVTRIYVGDDILSLLRCGLPRD